MTGRESLDVEYFAPHQLRVARNFPYGSVAYQVALYHDHLEDGLGDVPDEIGAHVLILTRYGDESYFNYIRRIVASGDRVALAVKRADLLDNLARCQGEYGGTKSPSERCATNGRWSLSMRDSGTPSARLSRAHAPP